MAARGSQAVNDFANGVKNTVVTGVQKVNEVISISPMINTKINLGVGPDPRNLVTTERFGPALPIVRTANLRSPSTGASGMLNVYCVECGTKGQVQLGGQAQWSVFTGLTKANIEMTGSISARVALGIEASIEAGKEVLKREIHRQGIPQLQVPKWFTIGPSIVLEAEGEISIAVQGQMVAGIQMDNPNFSANLDLVDRQKSVSSGFTPTFTKIFNASGEISAKAAIGLPLGIAFGIQIPALPDFQQKGKTFDKSLSLTTKPSIEAVTSYTPSTNGCPVNGNTCVNGLKNDLKCE